MELIIVQNKSEGADVAARIIAKKISAKPRSVLGLATGSSPLGLYEKLIEMHKEQGLKFSKVTTFNLDEYIGLPATDVRSYAHFMKEKLFDYLDIPESQRNIPDGMCKNIPEHCADYEYKIKRAGGIDIQILGIGSDGHIGFNEPSSSFASRTRIKTLTEQTIRDNARFFDFDESRVPKHVITMGIGTVMEAKMCILMAFGENKADAIASCVEGGISIFNPASALQLHPNAKIIIDDAAASKLKLADYYKWVYSQKPEWQAYS